MARRNVVKFPDEILGKRSKVVTVFDAHLWELLDDMADTMRAQNGVGIAAVQVGVLYRACIISSDKYGNIELINPRIVKATSEALSEEGCLSVPHMRGYVMRPQNVWVEAQDRRGKNTSFEFKGRDAVCACHEIDHLDGVLFSSKIEHA